MSNYPPGTGPDDPKAPWNASDPPVFEPIACEYCGKVEALNADNLCESCFLDKFEDEPTVEDRRDDDVHFDADRELNGE